MPSVMASVGAPRAPAPAGWRRAAGALLLTAIGLLQGCSLLPWNKEDDAASDAPSALATPGGTDSSADSAKEGADKNSADGPRPRSGFTVTVEMRDPKAPAEVRELLQKHLDLLRYRQLDDLGASELSRLMVAAEANARELLGTLGYFTPHLVLQLRDTPEARRPHDVQLQVDPGPRTRVSEVKIDFAGAMANGGDQGTGTGTGAGSNNAAAPPAQASHPAPSASATSAAPAPRAPDAAEVADIARQRAAILADWALPAERPFTQADWDAAKSQGLRTLTARHFPTGKVRASRADIDADTSSARLALTYDSGPAYRFGLLQIHGAERYGVVGPSRIAQLPTGEPYDQKKLLDAQQRLAGSGYYDSVFLTLDTEADPGFAPVIAQVREAPMQKVVLGVGFTTDSGPRVSIDHIYNRLPLLDWRAVSKLSIDRDNKVLNTTWNGLPDASGWKWGALAEIKRAQAGTYDADSGRLRWGRSKTAGHIDRALFLQYDYAVPSGTDLPDTVEPAASAISLNWNWTGRYFDDDANPRRGWGLALELGAGYTLSGQRQPFTRLYGRWLGLVPLGRVNPDDVGAAARQSRLALRAEVGAISAKEDARIPSTLRFLTGGDTTVRGYNYQQIGALDAGGATVAGRFMGVASVEWQKPIVWNGQLTAFESAVFVDAGNVASKASELSKIKVGVGAGLRWRSPVGPLQADLAYGVDVRKLRLHLRLGFTF